MDLAAWDIGFVMEMIQWLDLGLHSGRLEAWSIESIIKHCEKYYVGGRDRTPDPLHPHALKLFLLATGLIVLLLIRTNNK